MVIETERLVLKSISENDQKAMIDILVNNQVKETYMIPGFKENDVHTVVGQLRLGADLGR